MDRIVLQIQWSVKQRLRKNLRKVRDAGVGLVQNRRFLGNNALLRAPRAGSTGASFLEFRPAS